MLWCWCVVGAALDSFIFLDVGVGSISKGATKEESGVVFFGHVSPVRLVLEAGIELHEHEHLVSGQQNEVIWWIGYHIPLGRRITRA